MYPKKSAYNTRAQGFTLIELLVVIAIVGILASIIFAGLNGSRVSANDTKVKAELHEVAKKMEVQYLTNGHYGPTFESAPCPTASNPPDPIFYTDTNLRTIISAAETANGGEVLKCATGGTNANQASTWALASALKSTGPWEAWWCTDSAGKTKLSIKLNPNGWAQRILTFITPVAHAVVDPGPYLGGGTSAAVCP